MEIYKFKCWCEKAVSGVIFPPDQRKVYRELMDHMEDHYDCLLEQGVDEDAARQQTVDAMGDPWPIAKELAAIHRPFWGYFLRATRVILVIALLITVIPLGLHIWEDHYSVNFGPYLELYNGEEPDSDAGYTVLLTSEPNISRSSDGYTFTLTNAFLLENQDGSTTCLLFLEEFNPLPWSGRNEAEGRFWAEDSLGNVYKCGDEYRYPEDVPTVFSIESATSPFTDICKMWINDFPEDAQWVNIRYTRDGRDLAWYIDLTGGNAP